MNSTDAVLDVLASPLSASPWSSTGRRSP